MKRAVVLALVPWAMFAGLAHCGEETIRLKEGPGRELTVSRCATCHSLDYVEMNATAMSRSSWEKSVRKMIDRFGAPVSEEDAKRILEYLATHYSTP